MKRLILGAALVLLTAADVFAGGRTEDALPAEESAFTEETLNPLTLRLGVLRGPSGFGIIKLIEETSVLAGKVEVVYQLVPSPREMVARITSRELQAGLLPLNVAAKLYTNGTGYPLAAIPGRGALYILSRDAGLTDWDDLEGRTVYALGKGASPDYLFHYFLAEKGIEAEKVNLDFSIPAPQLVQMAAAGKAETLLLPQPFVAVVQLKAPEVEIRLNLQEAWMELQGTDSPYPITAFVADSRFAAQRPEAYAELLMAYQDSISWVLANPKEAAELIEKHGILAAGPARKAIPHCGLDFRLAADAKAEVEAYLGVLLESNPLSLGGRLPDENFYLAP